MDSIPTQEYRAEIVRTVKNKPSRLRAATSNTLMAVIGAAALAPIVATAGGAAPIALAVAGVVGSVGAGQLTTLLQRCADRVRGQKSGTTEAELQRVIQQTIQTEIAAQLDRGDAEAGGLLAELVQFIERIDGFEAALNSAACELHDHLRTEFATLERRTGDILESLSDIEYGQRHLLDRFDEFEKRYAQGPRQSARPGAQTQEPPPAFELDAYEPLPSMQITRIDPWHDNWSPGAEVVVGRERYLLYDRQTDDRLSPDSSMRLGTAVAQRLAPVRDRGIRFVWLRQLRRLRPGLMARAAESGLRREHELLAELSSERGAARAFPKSIQLDVDGATMTSALAWPVQRRGAAPCFGLDSLSIGYGQPMSQWLLAEILTGLGGLCDALAILHHRGLSHRDLTFDGILLAEDQRLTLRNLGKAGFAPAPGGTQSPYTAPEQLRRSDAPPGSPTDVYQLAALTYHLVAGHSPPRIPAPPLNSQAPGTPRPLAAVIDKALSTRPSERPTASALGDAFRAAADELA